MNHKPHAKPLTENAEALAWWRSLSTAKRKWIHSKSKHSHIPFTLFSASTKMIRDAWKFQPPSAIKKESDDPNT